MAKKKSVSRKTIPGSVDIPTADREVGGPDFSFSIDADIPEIKLPDDPLLDNLAATADELLGGEIPDDVASRVERRAAERGIRAGIYGEAAEGLTARDLGRTSVDLALQGAQIAGQVSALRQSRASTEAQLNLNRQQFSKEFGLKFASFKEDQRRHEDAMALAWTGVQTSYDQLALQGAQIVSANQQFMHGIIRDYTIANSEREIAGVGKTIKNMQNFFGGTAEDIWELIGHVD